MDWAFNKVPDALFPQELVPDCLRELLHRTSTYGFGSADSMNWNNGLYTEEAIARSVGTYDGVAFRIREIFYDRAHGLGPIGDL